MKSKKIQIDGNTLTIQKIFELTKNKQALELTKDSLKKAEQGVEFLNSVISDGHKIIYGITTGFGPMANYILPKKDIIQLQKNLIISHATGMGENISPLFVHSAMIVRLNTLAKGFSGTSPELLKQLELFINKKIIPTIPRHGAVGTSGDLVQLAHIALALIGKGFVYFNGEVKPTSLVLKQLKIKPYTLKAKEGLSLINGTSMMSGIAAIVCHKSEQLINLSIRSGSMGLEIIKGYQDSFSDSLHMTRPHLGQRSVAKTMSEILKSSKLIRNRKILEDYANKGDQVNKINESVQEVYSFRCIAQILGPILETLNHTKQVTETEINSVTDNPIIDWKNKTFLHGGNFHGDYIAVSMDQLKMSLVKLTMLSERRLNFLLNHKINGIFPPFLNLHTPGLTLGLQPLQFVATSTTAHNQTLAYPMNLHSISTNGDNQDVVSMGTDAALITHEVLDNAYIVQAIEMIALCQAVDFLNIKEKLSNSSKEIYKFTRKYIPKITDDREMQKQLKHFLEALKNWVK